jgi:quinol monooxygenase YgiN
MVIVMGTCKMEPGEIDRLMDAMRGQLEATRAEAGCQHYAFSRDVLDPDLLHIAERWDSNEALAAHFKTSHMAAFNAAIGAAKVLSLRVRAYDKDGIRTLMGE